MIIKEPTMKTTETNTPDYDFALSDNLNEKLKKAVMLLDEVRFKIAGEEYTQDFLNELNQGTKRITDAIRRLDQDPIV
jgi:predicted Zn-dependent protease